MEGEPNVTGTTGESQPEISSGGSQTQGGENPINARLEALDKQVHAWETERAEFQKRIDALETTNAERTKTIIALQASVGQFAQNATQNNGTQAPEKSLAERWND